MGNQIAEIICKFEIYQHKSNFFRADLIDMAAKIIAQIILQGSAVFTRAFFTAYSQALNSKYTNDSRMILHSNAVDIISCIHISMVR